VKSERSHRRQLPANADDGSKETVETGAFVARDHKDLKEAVEEKAYNG